MTSTESIDAIIAEAWEKRTSDPAGAVELAERAGRLSRESGGYARGEGWSLLTIGSCAILMGEYERAREPLEAASSLLADCGERVGKAHVLNGIGNVHWYHGNYAQSLENVQASLRIYQEIGNRRGEAIALGNIGAVHQAQGEYPQALEHYHASLRIRQEIGNRQIGRAHV